MKYCDQCGRPLKDEANFCDFCGRECKKPSERKKMSNKNHKPSKKSGFKRFIAAVVVISITIICITAVAFFGEKDKVSPVNSADDAIAQLEKIGKNLRYENALSELTPKTTTTIDGDSYYRLQQNYQGIPVYGRTVVYATDENGKTLAITGNVEDVDGNVEISPTVSVRIIRASIEQYAKDALGFVNGNFTVNIMPGKELVWYISSSGKTTLAYRLLTYIAEEPYEMVVDAHNGEIYKAFYQIIAESVPVTVTVSGYEHEVNIWKEDDGKYTTYDAERKIRLLSANGETLVKMIVLEDGSGAEYRYNPDQKKWYDEWGNVISTPTGTYISARFDFSTIENKKGITKPTFSELDNFDEDAARIMFFLSVSNDYFSKVLSRNGWGNNCGNTMEVVFNCDGKTPYCSSPVPELTMLCILSGDGLNVVTHEMTHAMESTESHMTYSGESGAIMEALSDIFAELVEYDCLGYCDWLFDGGVRNLITPADSTEMNKSHPSKYWGDHWIDPNNLTDDQGGVHMNSTVISHAAFLMSHSGGGYLEINELAKLWYRAMLMMPSDCDFAECRTLVELAGRSMNLSDEQIQCIREAFDAVGIPDEETVDYEMNIDSTLCVYGADSELFTDYTIQIEGKRFTLEKINELDKEDIGFPLDIVKLTNNYLADYSDSIEVSTAEAVRLDLPIGVYTITLHNDTDLGKTYIFKVSIGMAGGLDNLNIYTNFSERKLLRQVNAFSHGELVRTTIFQYNDKQQITGIHIAYLDVLDTEVDCTFTYDDDGRLLKADRDDFWYDFCNEEYVYSDTGKLMSHKIYWGSEGFGVPSSQHDFEYDDNGFQIIETYSSSAYDLDTGNRYLKKRSESKYTYVFNGQGCVSEKHRQYAWIDSDYRITTSFGSYWATEYDYVTKYTYDSAEQVVSEQQLYVIEDSSAEKESKTYCYDFYPLVSVSYGSSTNLVIMDTVGNPIWWCSVSDSDFVADADGYLSSTSVNKNGDHYEFYYDGDELPQKVEATPTEPQNVGIEPNRAVGELEYPISEEDAYIIFKTIKEQIC